MILLTLCGVALFGLVGWMVDRPSRPAYEARDRWRCMAMILMILLVAVGLKGQRYRSELRQVIRSCQ